MTFPMRIHTHTGGLFDTNCFFLEEHGILIDAPETAFEWLESKGFKPQLLLLTHGHIDHIWDAAQIKRAHGCAVACHADTVPMMTDPDFFRRFGFELEVETVPAEQLQLIAETPSQNFNGIDFQVLLVPGHCPGSLCFFDKTRGVLFGGDVIFAGGIGRTDLPGGDHKLLLDGIKNKIFPLGDDVTVLPGHGPATKIGKERKTNPYVSED